MRRQQSQSLASGSFAGTNSGGGIFDYEAVAGRFGEAVGAKEVGVWPIDYRRVVSEVRKVGVLSGVWRGVDGNKCRRMRGTYSGFPFFTSSAYTIVSGIAIPTLGSAVDAYARVAEVQTVHVPGVNYTSPSNSRSQIVKERERRVGHTESMASLAPGRSLIPPRPFSLEVVTMARSNRSASLYSYMLWVHAKDTSKTKNTHLEFRRILNPTMYPQVLHGSNTMRGYVQSRRTVRVKSEEVNAENAQLRICSTSNPGYFSLNRFQAPTTPAVEFMSVPSISKSLASVFQ